MRMGFIGLGTMDGKMAAGLQRAGYDLTVHDMRLEAAAPHLAVGATWADSPQKVAEACDVVLTSLPGPPEVEKVALGGDGLCRGDAGGRGIFRLSTNSPTIVRRINTAFAEHGAHMLDAPVSGGPRRAATRKLAVWVGGDRKIFDRYKPLLDAISDKARYVGPIGAATVVKLAHNCTRYILQRALSEVFMMGVKARVEPLALWEALRQGAIGRSRTFDDWLTISFRVSATLRISPYALRIKT